MADEKNDKRRDKKPPASGGSQSQNAVEILIGIIFILGVVGLILERIYSFFQTGEVTFYGFSLTGLLTRFKANLPVIKIISLTISGLFAFGAIVFSQMRGTIWISEKKRVFPLGEGEVGGEPVDVKNPMTDRWNRVLAHMDTGNHSDFRLAIIEADIMLNELLEKLNLRGETMADKLKAVEKSDFLTIDLAWEAHKVRNKLAHEGSEFLLNEREARQVVDLYRQVFEEFFMI